jgi:tetratricopeptide (TPR) repeat protein
MGHLPHESTMLPTATGSPTETQVTADPVSVTTPVNSCPGTKGCPAPPSWLLRTATTAGRWFEPAYGRPDRPDAELSSPEEADRWLRMNSDNWLGALRYAAGSAQHARLLDCAESMHWFSDRRVHWPQGSGMTSSVAALTRPYVLARVGECLGLLGRRAEAITALTEAIALMDQSQVSNFRQARALEVLATVLAGEGRAEEGRRAYARAAELFEAIGDAEASSRCHDLATTAP